MPRKISNSLWNEFRPLCNEFFNKLKTNKPRSSNRQADSRKGNSEEQILRRKISDLQNESIQFENNLEYFTDSSNDNPLFKDVTSKLTAINDKIEVFKKKLNKITKTKKAEVAKVTPTEGEVTTEEEA